MIKILQKLYEGADLSAASDGVMYFRLEEDCQIREIFIYADSPVPADTVFNCLLAGADLFSGGTRPKILSGEESTVKTGLSIDANKGDKFILDLDSLTGTLGAPLTLLLTVDDGVSSGGGSLPDWITNHPDAPPSSADAMDDEFTASSLDSKWSLRSSPGVAFVNQTLILTAPALNGDVQAIYQTLPSGVWKFRAKIQYENAATSNGNQHCGILIKDDGTNHVAGLSLRKNNNGNFNDWRI